MKLKIWLLSLLVVTVLSACSSSPAATTAAATAQQAAASATDTQTVEVVATSAPSVAAAEASNSNTHDDEEDYTWDSSAEVGIMLNGDSISTDAAGVSVDGTTITISAPGTYSLTGTLADGQIVVNSEQDGIVRLILNGVDLSNSSTAPIFIEAADEAMIVLADGTQNSVTDASSYSFADPAVEEPNAAIFSNADLTFFGSGALTVTANYNDAISTDDGLIVASGSITVTAVDDGLRGKEYILVKDGTVNVQAQSDGLKSDEDEDVEKGFIEVLGGTLNINVGGDAIQAQTDVMISGGSFNLVTTGGTGDSAKGIKGVVSVNIDGGSFSINTVDDALHSNGSITVNDGTFDITSGDDGVHADATVEFNGGIVQISQSYEGIESAVISINAGDIDITSSDDAINVAGGNDSSGTGGPGGFGGQDAFATSNNQYLYIRGGQILVNSNGDGLDINGSIEMTGGTVVVSGPISQGNGALDYDGSFNISGGIVAAAGSSGMAQAPGQNSGQNSLIIFFESNQAAGSAVQIVDSAGNAVLTFAPGKEFQSLVFSSSELVNGETYTVFTGGSVSGEAPGGLYADDSSYNGGSEYATFTVSSVVTQLGTGGGFGGPGRRGP